MRVTASPELENFTESPRASISRATESIRIAWPSPDPKAPMCILRTSIHSNMTALMAPLGSASAKTSA